MKTEKLYHHQYGSIEKHRSDVNKIAFFVAFFIVSILTILIVLLMIVDRAEVEHRPISNSCVPIACVMAEETPEMPVIVKKSPIAGKNEDIKPEVTKVDVIATNSASWQGKVSHYSREGCLGCSATLTMANGQPLDDNAMTIAFNHLPMNTKVRLTNLDNGKSVIATVTDTGGFERLGRIADLVPAVKNALETKTDQSEVLIEQL